MSIAPWHVYLCGLRLDDENVKNTANKMYEDMQKAGIEVLFDDRDVSAGVKFADCDLMGMPIRVVVSPRGLNNGTVEVQTRDKVVQDNVPVDGIIEYVSKLIKEGIDKLDA